MQADSYAKINLYLEIMGVLPNNYHEVNTVFCSIDLCDSIKYALTKKPVIKLWSNVAELESQNNLIYKVVAEMQCRYKPDTGVEIYLEKRIPLAAGLGGGSSNAALTILALNDLWDLQLQNSELEALAAGFGSDVNFFLHGGTALGRGRGEQIEPLPDIDLKHLLLVNPGIRISAAEAYGMVRIAQETDRMPYDSIDALKGNINRLEPGIRDAYPVIDGIISDLYAQDALLAMLSGSGSTCFGVFEDAQALQTSQRKFESQGFWTHSSRTLTKEEFTQCSLSLN